MNIGRSIKVGLARSQGPNNHKELAKELGVSEGHSINMAMREYANSRRIKKLADIFGVAASEFIAWGE